MSACMLTRSISSNAVYSTEIFVFLLFSSENAAHRGIKFVRLQFVITRHRLHKHSLLVLFRLNRTLPTYESNGLATTNFAADLIHTLILNSEQMQYTFGLLAVVEILLQGGKLRTSVGFSFLRSSLGDRSRT